MVKPVRLQGDIPGLMLSPAETASRIKAARLVRGVSQAELAEKFVAAGLPWRLVGSLERAEQPLLSAHLAALTEALDLPPGWFTQTFEELFDDGGREEKLDRIIELLESQR